MRFLISFIFVFIIGLGSITAINWIANVNNNFRNDYTLEQKISDVIAGGENYQGKQDYNEVAANTLLIQKIASYPQAVIFGSSRSMLVRGHHLSEQNFFNHSTSSSRIEQYVEIYSSYEQAGSHPRVVVLGVDPWIFNGGLGELRMKAADPRLVLAFLDTLGVTPAELGYTDHRDYQKLVSIRLLEQSLKSFHDKPCDKLIARTDEKTDCAIRRADGSLRYPHDYEAVTVQSVTDKVRLSVSRRGHMHAFQNYHELDPARVKLFRAFVTHLIKSSTTVMFFLAPYHPMVVDAFRNTEDWKMLIKAESEIRQVAQKLGIPILGDYDPNRTNCDITEFYDGIHARVSCIAKILKPTAVNSILK